MKPAPILWALLFLFVLRVLGQLAVFLGLFPWLPPMEEWYSGLVPYGPLLASQVLIIALCTKVCLDLTRGHGRFAEASPRVGRGLFAFGLVYLAVMIARYVIRMSLLPEERWTGGAIPIFFHWVLAAFLLVLGRHHSRARLR